MRYSEIKIAEGEPKLIESTGTTRIDIGGTTYEVGNDLIKEGSIYKIFSGDSARAWAEANDAVVPPLAVVQAVYKQAKPLMMPIRQNNPKVDTNAEAHHQQIIEINGQPSGFVAGHKKEIVEGPGTRIFGGRWPEGYGRTAGSIIQKGQSNHGGGHVDYSQGMRLCRVVDESTKSGAQGSKDKAQTESSKGLFIIGDSHAKAIPGGNNLARNGATTAQTVSQAQKVPNGSTVIVSTGHNDVAAGKTPGQIANAVSKLIKDLTARGIKVQYVLFPEGTKNPNQENMGPTREAIADLVDVYFDLEGQAMSPDGKHASMSVYRSIPLSSGQDAVQPVKPKVDKERDDPASYADGQFLLKEGPPYPKEEAEAVKGMQYVLTLLGYDVGSTGMDGKYGPRTARAVRAFKKDYKISGDGRTFGMDSIRKVEGIADGSVAVVRTPKPYASKQDNKDATAELPNLPQDSVTQGKVGLVLDFIAGPESGGRYDAVYPGRRRPEILDMTLRELYRDMAIRAKKTKSSASGRYQYITSTLKSVVNQMGLDPDKTKFTPEIQDKIVIYHLRKNHGLDKWLAGNLSNEKFLRRLAGTWAGLPNPYTNRSVYYGDGLNKAGFSAKVGLDALQKIQGQPV